MPLKIKIKSGDIFSSDADTLVIPLGNDLYNSQRVAEQIKEHWRVDIIVPDNLILGDYILAPARNSIRTNNGNPANFLIFTNLGSDDSEKLKTLGSLVSYLTDFSEKNSNVRDIAIPMESSWADPDVFSYVFKTFDSEFFTKLHRNCEFELFFPAERDADKARKQLENELIQSSKQRKLRRKYHDQSNRDKVLSSDFYIIRGYAELGKNEIDPWKSQLSKINTAQTKETFQQVRIGSLVFRSVNMSASMDFLPVSAIGEVVGNEEGKLDVLWFSEGFTGQIKNRNYPLQSIVEVTMDYEKREMYQLMGNSFFSEFSGEFSIVETERMRKPGMNTDFANDYEIGEDYLDIEDDVDAFARIVALRDLRPPLAIALCGKWGAGKSFFMGKMIKKMQSLSQGSGDLFCKGMVHIQFNAWSYLDSNLWAGLVTRIFNGINEYVNNHITSEAIRDKIKKDLHEKVSLSQQSVFKMESEKIVISKRVEDLVQEREELAVTLEKDIKKLKNRSYTDFVCAALKEFNVEAHIDQALQQNESVKEVSDYIRKHFPEELWADGKWMKREVSWWKTFFLDFFARKRLKWNIPIVIVIALIIYFVPEYLNLTVLNIGTLNFTLPEHFLTWIFLAGTFVTKIVQSYKKIQPLFATLWQVRKRYVEQLEDTKSKWYQEEKVLMTQINLENEKLIQLEEGLSSAKNDLANVEFRLLNRLNTEAFQGFIKDKSSAEGYRKHLGIVATIRDDFETLSNLFEAYAKERKDNPESNVIDRPLERIVLYIDDLDRCSEARVLEVLEAVHLIMAFNLFVVVVGIDPTRVKSALSNQLLTRKAAKKDTNLSSRYLEKIFQVPFHLDQPSDQSVKNMITKLLTPVKKKNSEISNQPEGESEDEKSSTIPSVQSSTTDAASAGEKPKSATETIPIEKLLIDEVQIKRISDFSLLIGSNPRSVKRFVNILRIVRAHAGNGYNQDIPDTLHAEVIMFLLALSTGPYQLIYKNLTSYLKTEPNDNIYRYFESVSDRELIGLRDVVLDFLGQSQQRELAGAGIELFADHNTLVSRFTFEDLR